MNHSTRHADDSQTERRDTIARPPAVTRALPVVLALAVAVSVVHYVDNFVRFDEYAKNPDTPITPIMVPIGWLIFTTAGVAGYLLFRRHRWGRAAALLALYSVSGLIGLGHYHDAPPRAFGAFQNVFIVTDIALGLAVLALALSVALLGRHRGRTP